MNADTTHGDDPCPGDADLRAFNMGMLLEQSLEDLIANHLGECRQCESRLEMLDASNDSILALLREPSPLGSTPEGCDADGIRPCQIQSDQKPDGETQGGGTDTWKQRGRKPSERENDGIPEKIGKYFVLDELGHGGFGRVFKAKAPDSNRLVAIKVPRLHSDERVQQFLKEARTAAELEHPGIVQVFDWGRQDDSSCFVVMQLIDGKSLRQLLRTERISHRRAAELTAEIARALHYAHSRENAIYHRDVKPANILVDRQGKAHLGDFGLAVREASRREHKGEVAGTYAYMAPEQVRGEADRPHPGTDIWALGVILYEMLTCQEPFSGRDAQLFDEIENREPRPPRTVDESIPTELERICLACLSKSISQRYTTASDLANDLELWAEHEAIDTQQHRVKRTETTAKIPATVRAPIRRLPWRFGTSLMMLVLILAVVAGGWTAYERTFRPIHRSVDRAKVGIPFPLLRHEPVKLLWNDEGAKWNAVYDPEQQELRLETDTLRLMQLNETSTDSFRIQVAMSKDDQWRGGAGLFWGFQLSERENGEPIASCQAIFLDYHRGRDAFLMRGVEFSFSRLNSVEADCHMTPFCAHEVPAPHNHRCFLEVEVVNGKVKAVRYQRQGIPQSVINGFRDRSHTGRLGVLNLDGATTFHGHATDFTPLRGEPL